MAVPRYVHASHRLTFCPDGLACAGPTKNDIKNP